MRFPELVKGERYILDAPQGQVAIYEGQHDGKLILADGSTFYGRQGMLRFSYVDERGVQRTALFENAGAAKETEAAKLARERLEVEQAALKEAALAEATEFLTRLGFVVGDKRGPDPNQVSIRNYSYNKILTADEVEVEDLTIGKLKQAIQRGQPIAAR